jgi:hypothetical protein
MTTHALTAKAIREELKRYFPGTKFQVTSRSFSMGDDVSIGWLNGPTTEAVEKITDKYQEGNFNGMEDIYEYDNRREDIPQVKYVMTSRSISPEILENTAKEIAKRFGFDGNDEHAWIHTLGDWKQQAVYKELRSKSL